MSMDNRATLSRLAARLVADTPDFDDLLGASGPMAEVRVGGFELQLWEVDYDDDDWEYVRDGGKKIMMGRNGRGGQVLFTKSEAAKLKDQLLKFAQHLG